MDAAAAGRELVLVAKAAAAGREIVVPRSCSRRCSEHMAGRVGMEVWLETAGWEEDLVVLLPQLRSLVAAA